MVLGTVVELKTEMYQRPGRYWEMLSISDNMCCPLGH